MRTNAYVIALAMKYYDNGVTWLEDRWWSDDLPIEVKTICQYYNEDYDEYFFAMPPTRSLVRVLEKQFGKGILYIPNEFFKEIGLLETLQKVGIPRPNSRWRNAVRTRQKFGKWYISYTEEYKWFHVFYGRKHLVEYQSDAIPL